MLEMHERRHEIIDTYWPEDDIGDDRPKDRER
jgi:hypothetical protein